MCSTHSRSVVDAAHDRRHCGDRRAYAPVRHNAQDECTRQASFQELDQTSSRRTTTPGQGSEIGFGGSQPPLLQLRELLKTAIVACSVKEETNEEVSSRCYWLLPLLPASSTSLLISRAARSTQTNGKDHYAG